MSTPLSLRRAATLMPLAPSGLRRFFPGLTASLLVVLGLLLSPQYSLADGFFVSGVSPASGPTTGGTIVTITGHEFTGASAVNFGATPAAFFTVNSDLSITATSPAGVAGTVDVTVSVDASTTGIVNVDEFTFIPSAVATPTLSQWSMLALAFLLACAGCRMLRTTAGGRIG